MVLLIGAVLRSAPAWGERPRPGSRPATVAGAAPYLWRVEKDGRVSHLFGTVHVGLDLDQALGAAGRRALDEAHRVFVEIDMMAVSLGDVLHLAWARAELPPGQSLRSLVAPASWDRLTRLSGRDASPVALERLQPWVATLVAEQLVAKPPGKRPKSARRGGLPLDDAIAQDAERGGRQVMALETPLEAILAFAAAGRLDGVEMLEEVLRLRDASRRDWEHLVDAYAARDDRLLLKAFGRMERHQPVFTQHILVRRNERWCERLDLWLGDGGLFIAAGTFHMFGKRGLVSMLRERGYRVTRVRDTVPAGAGSAR